MSLKEDLKKQVKEFPTEPGVYLMRSSSEKILYVGKAKNLRNRVRSYFLELKDMSAKTKLLVQNIQSVEYLITKTEVEAFLLEASLIKKHRPKYNVRLKDDKSYPYIRLSMQDSFPRLYLARKVKKDGSLYFGPYTSGMIVAETIRFLNRTFKVRDCTDAVFKTRKRPCMTYQIGRCEAPCVKMISPEAYLVEIESAKAFLKGRDKKVLKLLEEKMTNLAHQEKFEVAAKVRDSIQAIKKVFEKQAVINSSVEKDLDAIGYFGTSAGCLIETIHIRAGRVIGNRSHFLPGINIHSESEDPRDWLVSFLNQYYFENFIPDEVLLPIDLGNDLNKLLEAVLKERATHQVSVRFATDEKGRKLTEMANKNAESHIEQHLKKHADKNEGLLMIQEKFELSVLPERIECYDVSHFQGTEIVASQVVFENGLPNKDQYRRYKIKTVEQNNDYASMHEVLTRRFSHKEWDEPQLIVIDGGKGQLAVAQKVLKELGKEIPIVGLAKARTQSGFAAPTVESSEERFFIPGRANPVVFKPASQAFQILIGIRDEAHRFALSYHRKLRENRTLESELDYVVGLGLKKKQLLLKSFGSIDELKAADIESIAQLKGFNRILAERILLQLNEDPTEEDESLS